MGQELLRFDPRKIPGELLEYYFFKLETLSVFDKFTEAFAAVGWSDLSLPNKGGCETGYLSVRRCKENASFPIKQECIV